MQYGSTNTYGPSVQIGEDKCAQLMFVIRNRRWGTNSPKLERKLKICDNDAKKSK